MNAIPFEKSDFSAFREKYEGKSIVIKASGDLFTIANSPIINNLCHQLVVLKSLNVHPILVHGCGNYLKSAFEQAGKPRVMDADGNYDTTEETISLVSHTMKYLNTHTYEYFNKLSVSNKWTVKSCGMSSFSQGTPIVAEPLKQRTGKVAGIKTQELADKLVFPIVPILSSLGVDQSGAEYNVNADDVACAIAKEVGAPRLILLSSTPGVLNDEGRTLTFLDQKRADKLIAEEVITGGMKKKVTQMLAAATHVKGVAAMSFYEPYGILKELMYKKGADTSTLVKLKPQPGGMA